LIKRLKVEPGQRVLELGTGWGSLAILLAQTVDCQIDTITLSFEQAQAAAERVASAGFSHCIAVHHMDFREIRNNADWENAFDRFISIEMIENVGKDFIAEYWSVVNWALRPMGAVGTVQVITMPEYRIAEYDKGADFIQKWIFPGAYIPSVSYLIKTMEQGSSGCLLIDSIVNIGPHYARTLREWKRKFLANWDTLGKQYIKDEHHLSDQQLDIFMRKWIYYFDYCEAGFACRHLGDHVITFTRPHNVSFGCVVEEFGA